MSSKAWETTGVDVSRDRIVELAATQGHDLAHLPGASFSEVVRVPEGIQRSGHLSAPPFSVLFLRMSFHDISRI